MRSRRLLSGRKASPRLSQVLEGPQQRHLRFASAENRKTFEANPDKYVPAYVGFCAFGVSVGAKFDGDPRYWKIVDGQLYLNLNEDIQKTWLEDVPGNIEKANKAWKRIEHSDPTQLS
jgi:hypothetical protein